MTSCGYDNNVLLVAMKFFSRERNGCSLDDNYFFAEYFIINVFLSALFILITFNMRAFLIFLISVFHLFNFFCLSIYFSIYSRRCFPTQGLCCVVVTNARGFLAARGGLCVPGVRSWPAAQLAFT